MKNITFLKRRNLELGKSYVHINEKVRFFKAKECREKN